MSTQTPAPESATTATVHNRWAGLAVLAASLLVVVMDMTVLNVALPDLIADLRPGAVAQLWIVDAYPVVLAGLLVPVSSLADRWGRKRMLLAGFTVFGLASLLALLADSPGEVIALRAVLGLGGAMIMPTTLSLIRTLFPDPAERATALGIWAAMASVGSAVGPIVGGALLERFSWHSAFLVNVPLMVGAVIAGLVLLPESRSSRPGRLDATGVLLSVGGMVGITYAVKHLGKHGADGQGLVVLVVGVLAMVLFVRRCLTQPEPMLAVGLFRDRMFRSGVVTAVAHSGVTMALLLVGSQWLQLVLGWSPLAAGAALLPMALGGMIGSPFAPAVAARAGVRPVLVTGLLLTAAGLATIFVLPRPIPYPGVAVALLAIGLGGAALGVGSALMMGRAPAHQSGSAAAIEEMSFEVGAVLGVSILGSLAGLVYRAGLPDGVPDPVSESVAGALGTSVENAATTSFIDAFATVGLAGALAVLLAAAVVWWWLPRDLDLADLNH
ncbi:MFS transporter [Kineosporia succinea]|uniref:DHA2 family multidrug resistance protein-like MFS transporter n=1 Tax=Kineosporia succinea TaxID=84632 RepID=A0ABT9P886_9ACTN|nr:MFS transporter [Kineosporia succinea]MDP9828893.1 DHA2 family multidrug resistance protein-like MFS transporter [Kineosporia succinea]